MTDQERKTELIAEVILDELLNAKVDLYYGQKSKIRRVIVNAMAEAERRWPELEEARKVRELR